MNEKTARLKNPSPQEDVNVPCPKCSMPAVCGRWCNECGADLQPAISTEDAALPNEEDESLSTGSQVKADRLTLYTVSGACVGTQRLVLKNDSGADLSQVIARTDGSFVRYFENLADGAEATLDVPASALKLVASAHLAGDRLCAQWILAGSAKVSPTVRVMGAGKMGKVVVKAKGGEIPVIEAGQAGDIGDVEIHYEADRKPERQYVAVLSETIQKHYPDWLCEAPWQNLRVFMGETLTIGRDGRCEFPVLAREVDGHGIVALDSYGSRIILSPAELARKDVKFPVSGRHVSLRWSGGGSVLVMDGTSQRASKRGVFSGGMRLDPGWNSLALPAHINLGRKQPRVELDLSRVEGPRGEDVLCIRQSGTTLREAVLWVRPGEWVGFSDNPQGGWYPTWCEAETEIRIQASDGIWRAKQENGGGLVTSGSAVRSTEAEYRCATATHELLHLQRAVRSR